MKDLVDDLRTAHERLRAARQHVTPMQGEALGRAMDEIDSIGRYYGDGDAWLDVPEAAALDLGGEDFGTRATADGMVLAVMLDGRSTFLLPKPVRVAEGDDILAKIAESGVALPVTSDTLAGRMIEFTLAPVDVAVDG